MFCQTTQNYGTLNKVLCNTNYRAHNFVNAFFPSSDN